MAEYKIVDAAKLDNDLKSVADSIRAKTGTTETMLFPEGFKTEIERITTGGGGGNDETLRAVVEGDATEIILPNSVSKIKSYKFYRDTTLVNIQCAGLTSIGEGVFYGCTNLALTELPAGLTSIGENVFYDCKNLALTELPAGLTSISNNVFYQCTNLALTELPAGLTSIGASVFNGCTNLALTELPAGLKGKLEGVFNGCTKNTIKTVPTGITEITNSAFIKNGMTEFIVPANTKLNGYRPFGECTNLNKVTFLGKVTVTATAFYGCTNLKTINVPWAEGEVSNAPWGATNATINYNYSGA